MKDALAALIEVITRDPDTQHAEIQYKIDIEDRNSLASPRGHIDWGIEAIRSVKVA